MVSNAMFNCLLVALFGAARCSAFAPPTPHRSAARSTGTPPYRHILSVEDAGGGTGDADGDSLFSPFLSPEAAKQNVLEGEFGERGEQYVAAQFGLLLLIATGGVPVVGNFLASLLGPALVVAGLLAVYRAAADLRDNLSPWPVPVDPRSGRGSLVDAGIYASVRHPMYSGLLLGMIGLSLSTESATRLFLTGLLFLVLDAKSEFEETKLVQTYGVAYEDYQKKVPGKFLPPSMNISSKPRTEEF